MPFIANQMVTEPESDILGSPHDFDSRPPARPVRSPHRPVSTDAQLSDTAGIFEENHEEICDSTRNSGEGFPDTAMVRWLLVCDINFISLSMISRERCSSLH